MNWHEIAQGIGYACFFFLGCALFGQLGEIISVLRKIEQQGIEAASDREEIRNALDVIETRSLTR